MELNNYHCIGQGKIIHKRTKDTENFFQYKAPYLCINLNQTQKIHPLISLNRFNFFSIFYKQHGYRDKNKTLFNKSKSNASNSFLGDCDFFLVFQGFTPVNCSVVSATALP